VQISINGCTAERTMLPDDPADARGVLSHKYRFHPGSYGWMVSAKVDREKNSDVLEEIRKSRKIVIRIEVPADTKFRGGLSIFGEKLGRYPTDPAVTLTFSRPLDLPAGFESMKPVTVNQMVLMPETVIPTAREKPSAWRYTQQAPEGNWQAESYDDSQWKKGRASFGSPGIPNSPVNTRWQTGHIWLRRTFRFPDPESISGAILRVFHDEDVQIYVNGELLLRKNGYTTDYVDISLDQKQLKLFRKNTNSIAVHCRQTAGAQHVDVGISVFKKGK
jgi:hypothetical protein